MGQDEENLSRYTPLALHLVKDFFLNHESKDVQLLVACCIADILRIYAPEAPFSLRQPNQIKVSNWKFPHNFMFAKFPHLFTGNLRISHSSVEWAERSKRSRFQKILLST